MNNYTVVSDRVGTPGEPFTPADGVNVEALLEHGFIKHTTKKSAKITVDDSEQENQ